MNYIFNQALDYILLAFGFGFVIFFHELGHFLAAKYCDVKVDQFAVGFGSAIFAWRKGLGLRRGTTQKEFLSRIETYLDEQRAQGLQFKEHVGSWTDEQIRAGARK